MKSLVCHLFCILALVYQSGAAPAEDEVIDLPGVPSPPSFKQYAGYLTANGGRHLFYWLTEAETVDPATAPVVIWMNGGPGCSSVDGFLTENGPFRINLDGATVSYNPYSWNKVANVIFLEAPAGVGFSYSDDGQYLTNDDQTATDNYAALLDFFVKFPEYQSNPFFLTGESYAGMYIPMLASLIVAGDNNINFQGFAVGNGFHDRSLNFNAEILYNAFHGLHSTELFNSLVADCCLPTVPPTCDFFHAINADCTKDVVLALDEANLSGVNIYSIYTDCVPSVPSRSPRNWRSPLNFPDVYTKEQVEMIKNLQSDAPCSNSWPERQWLNSAEVKAALHVSDQAFPWDACTDNVPYVQQYETMTSEYEYLLNHTRVLLYHGDTDTVCNYIGGEWFADSLGRQVLQSYRPWRYANQTAGFVKEYTSLTFATILGSGHMVPTDRPAQALQMFTDFLNNVPLA